MRDKLLQNGTVDNPQSHMDNSLVSRCPPLLHGCIEQRPVPTSAELYLGYVHLHVLLFLKILGYLI